MVKGGENKRENDVKNKIESVKKPKKAKKRDADYNYRKARKEKRKRDDDAPKRAMTAYFAYLGENRNIIKEDYPDLAHKDILKKAGELWNQLKSSEKEKYEKIANDDKKR